MSNNILYLHGFASSYNPESEKIRSLRSLGNVFGINLDYTQGQDAVIESVKQSVYEYDIDYLIGTSMGGWLSSVVSSKLDIPFFALNPVISPSKNLQKYVGTNTDYAGNTYTLTSETVKSYDDFAKDARGVVFVNMGDEVIDSEETFEYTSPYYIVIRLQGGNHQFTNVDDITEKLQDQISLFNSIHT